MNYRLPILTCLLFALMGCEWGGIDPDSNRTVNPVTAMESSRPVCSETCDDIECGIGPCGQICGACRLGSVCTGGLCVCSEDSRAEKIVDNHCGSVTARGQCHGDILRRCKEGEIEQLPCGEIGRTCGWDSDALNGEGANTCLPTGLQAETCTPRCEDRICGDDGCGGTCGECPSAMACMPGGSCAARELCDSAEKIGVCNGDTLQYCADGCTVAVPCGSFGLRCGFDMTAQRFECLPCNGTCELPEAPPRENIEACDDGNDCTYDELVEGRCVHRPRPDESRCGLDNACVADGRCHLGTCEHRAATYCDDGDPCTVDTCDSENGCLSSPLDSGACDDGDPCTSQDVCVGGTCVGGPPPVEVCNGHDDDCDDLVDESCECVADIIHHSGPLTVLKPSGTPATVVSDTPAHWESASAAMPDSKWIWRATGADEVETQHFFMPVLVPSEVTSVEGMLSIAADHDVLVRINGTEVFNSTIPDDGGETSVEAGFATYREIDEWLVTGSNTIEFRVHHPAAITDAEAAGLIFELSTIYRFPSSDGICLLP